MDKQELIEGAINDGKITWVEAQSLAELAPEEVERYVSKIPAGFATGFSGSSAPPPEDPRLLTPRTWRAIKHVMQFADLGKCYMDHLLVLTEEIEKGEPK